MFHKCLIPLMVNTQFDKDGIVVGFPFFIKRIDSRIGITPFQNDICGEVSVMAPRSSLPRLYFTCVLFTLSKNLSKSSRNSAVPAAVSGNEFPTKKKYCKKNYIMPSDSNRNTMYIRHEIRHQTLQKLTHTHNEHAYQL